MRRAVLGLLMGCLLVLGFPRAASAATIATHVDEAPDESFSEYVPGAAGLEGRLLAPCCWDASRQTLDIHGSPIANELRREIRHRLKAGETPDAIQADLVRRYTTKILAVPPDNPLPRLGTYLSFGLFGAGGLATAMVVRWRRRSKEAREKKPEPPSPDAKRDEWDEKLDEALDEQD